MSNVIIYAPAGSHRYRRECEDWCGRHELRIIAIAHTAQAAIVTLERCEARAIVVARHHHLDDLASQFVWVVSEPTTDVPPAQQRTRRRGGAVS